jgi:hypothetical protein
MENLKDFEKWRKDGVAEFLREKNFDDATVDKFYGKDLIIFFFLYFRAFKLGSFCIYVCR